LILFFSRKEAKALVLLRRSLFIANINRLILFFSRKEAKALVLLRRSPFLVIISRLILFFSRKEAKALVLLRRNLLFAQTSAKPTQGVWGLAPKKSIDRCNKIRTTQFPLQFQFLIS
jgi:ribosomal protein L24E